MTTVAYENTFEGWLTAVFEIYEYGHKDVCMEPAANYQAGLFAAAHEVVFQQEKCRRVLEGLRKKVSARAIRQLYYSFLSEEEHIADSMLAYVRHVFASSSKIETDYGHPAVLKITQTAKKVSMEKCRMEGFVRFQLTKDQLYYSMIEPDYNLLPILHNHFKHRFADQRWLIYDTRRKFGIYYDLNKIDTVELSLNDNMANGGIEINDEQEELYQKLWKQYYSSINIPARKNTKLHLQFMPKRYWKNLIEKL